MNISIKNLKNIVDLLLREASEKHKEAISKLPSLSEKISPFVNRFSKNGVVNYAFTMVSVPKVGINPGYKYGTPLGIYFYPLDNQRFAELKDDKLPFVSHLENFGLVRIKNPEKWLNVADNNLKLDLQHVYRIGEKIILGTNEDTTFPSYKSLLNKSKLEGWSWKKSKAGKLFDFTYFLSQESEKYNKKPAFVWTSILKEMGYEGIYDPGLSVIHSSEPAQLVAFSKSAVEVIDLFNTKEVRKKDYEIYRQALLEFFRKERKEPPQTIADKIKFHKYAIRNDSDILLSILLSFIIDKDKIRNFIYDVVLPNYPNIKIRPNIARHVIKGVYLPEDKLIQSIIINSPKSSVSLLEITSDLLDQLIDYSRTTKHFHENLFAWYKFYRSINLGEFFFSRAARRLTHELPAWISKNKHIEPCIDFNDHVVDPIAVSRIANSIIDFVINGSKKYPDLDKNYKFSTANSKLQFLSFSEKDLEKITDDLYRAILDKKIRHGTLEFDILKSLIKNEENIPAQPICDLIRKLPREYADNIVKTATLSTLIYSSYDIAEAIIELILKDLVADPFLDTPEIKRFFENQYVLSTYIENCEKEENVIAILTRQIESNAYLLDTMNAIIGRIHRKNKDINYLNDLEKICDERLSHYYEKDKIGDSQLGPRSICLGFFSMARQKSAGAIEKIQRVERKYGTV